MVPRTRVSAARAATSPGFEILDVTLKTRLAIVTGNSDLVARLRYYCDEEVHPDVIDLATIVAAEFLDRIGATVRAGERDSSKSDLQGRDPNLHGGSARSMRSARFWSN
jgi:hypothetical protein